MLEMMKIRQLKEIWTYAQDLEKIIPEENKAKTVVSAKGNSQSEKILCPLPKPILKERLQRWSMKLAAAR